MNSFSTKFPAFAALLLIVANFGKNLAVQGETIVQKAESEVALLPQVLAFYPQASGLGAEITALKSSPTDIEAGVETLVTDFGFTSDKAKALIPKAFAVGEWAVSGVAPIEDLVGVLKS